jgi:hypothetical protein
MRVTDARIAQDVLGGLCHEGGSDDQPSPGNDAIVGAVAADQTGLRFKNVRSLFALSTCPTHGSACKKIGPLLSIGLAGREGSVRQNEVRFALGTSSTQ